METHLVRYGRTASQRTWANLSCRTKSLRVSRRSRGDGLLTAHCTKISRALSRRLRCLGLRKMVAASALSMIFLSNPWISLRTLSHVARSAVFVSADGDSFFFATDRHCLTRSIHCLCVSSTGTTVMAAFPTVVIPWIRSQRLYQHTAHYYLAYRATYESFGQYNLRPHLLSAASTCGHCCATSHISVIS